MSSEVKILLGGKKKGFIWSMLALVFFMAGTFVAMDWNRVLFGVKSLYPYMAKGFVSLLCGIIVFSIGKHGLDRRDTFLLRLAFVFIVTTDILMQVVDTAPTEAIKQLAFTVGAVVSTIGHIVLIVRHGRGFKFLRSNEIPRRRKLMLPVVIYVSVALIFTVFIFELKEIQIVIPGLFYAVFIAGSMWIAWETVRFNLFPRRNALCIGLGLTLWFLTEISGLIHNAGFPFSHIMYNFTWIFYTPTLILVALSGFRWEHDFQ